MTELKLDISSSEEIEEWLNGAPSEVAVVIATRCATRAFPLIVSRAQRDNFSQDRKLKSQDLIISAWRCLLTSYIAANYSFEDSSLAKAAGTASTDATVSATRISFVSSNAATAATAAYAAARTVYSIANRDGAIASAVRTVSAAERAVIAATEDDREAKVLFWKSISADCNIAENYGYNEVFHSKLWMAGQNSEVAPEEKLNTWAEKFLSHDNINAHLGPAGELLLDWFNPIVAGEVNAGWWQHFLSPVARELALKPTEFWQVTDSRPGEIVMEEVASFLEDPSNVHERPFIFLSYSRDDRENVVRIRQFLLDHGLPVWWDYDIPAGEEWRSEISRKVEEAACVLTLWTETSIDSFGVREEAQRAQLARKLVHARLEPVRLPYGFGETQYIDLDDWGGSEAHLGMRKLIQALRDKLYPPAAPDMAARILATAPMGVVTEDGRLDARDTPVGVAPPRIDPDELEERREATLLLAEDIGNRCDSGAYQVPTDLRHSLSFAIAILRIKLSWFSVEDAEDGLASCMASHHADDAWNATLVGSLNRLRWRMLELKPLLQPLQVPFGEVGAKPPEPEPILPPDEIGNIRDMAVDVAKILDSPEAKSVLSNNLIEYTERGVAQIDAGAEIAIGPSGDSGELRKGVKKVAYAVGGIITAVSTGIGANLLTSPEAAATLASKLTPFWDAFLKLFL
jgi:TIR domain-containing protein